MKISIIGSSHSRDIFNLRYNKDYNKEYKVVSYAPTISFLSIMSGHVLYNYRRMLMSGMDDERLDHWYIELEKNVLKTLESVQPDVLLMDFYADARYGAMTYGSEYITNEISDLIGKGIIVGKNLGIVYSYEQNTDDFIIMWKNFIDRFMAYMREKLPDTQIVVNTMKATELVKIDRNKTVAHRTPELEDVDINRMNNLWNIFDKYVIKKYKLKSIMKDEEYAMDLSYNEEADNIQLMRFQNEYYTQCFKDFIGVIESKEASPYKESHENLVSDSAFKHDLNYWSNMIGKYQFVEYNKYKGIKVADCREQLGEYSPQIWSRAIEIEGDGQTEYTLSFYIRIPDISVINNNMIIFRIRTFNHIKQIKADETIDWQRLTLEGHDIKSGEEYRYTYTFKPFGKCLKLAPFLVECIPDVEYNRIKLERSAKASEYTM